jgi:hypothetical protein
LKQLEEEEEDVSGFWTTVRAIQRYWKLKDVALNRTVWRTGFVRNYGPVVTQTA